MSDRAYWVVIVVLLFGIVAYLIVVDPELDLGALASVPFRAL